MCGFVAIFHTRERRPVDEALLGRMNDSLSHRGPDGDGTHVEPGVGLGHRRLSIIDLAGGHQPLYNEDHSVVVVYNGEIYNFRELEGELEARGHAFRTRCDTEVIVHAWEEWGEACVERFRGMFAFALYDRGRDTLFLARDRLGIKPLYYAELPDGDLIAGSELKALLAHPGLAREQDPRSVEDYFAYGYIPEPRTIFRGARKLAPGHVMRAERGRPPVVREYWDLPFRSHGRLTERDAIEELRMRIDEAVRIRLVSDVPLGAFLSGGVDSSIVVETMSRVSEGPVDTCSISFGDPRYNESAYAERVGRQLGTHHHTEQVDPDDFDLVDRLAAMYDEPFADSSAIPTFRVCEMARRRVTVALSGDGGDENLAGYRRHRLHMAEERVRQALPATVRRIVFGALGAIYPKADWAPRFLRAKTTFEGIARDPVDAYFHTVSIMGDRERAVLFSGSLRHDLQEYRASDVLRAHADRAPELARSGLPLIQYLDFKTYLAGDILTKVDRASMANSLEVRVPLLDHLLVEWISGLSDSLKLRRGEGKYLLKRAYADRLPHDVLYRPKMGFSVPLDAWFRGPLAGRLRSALLDGGLSETGLFDVAQMRRMVDQHQSGLRSSTAGLWALLMFDAHWRRVAGA